MCHLTRIGPIPFVTIADKSFFVLKYLIFCKQNMPFEYFGNIKTKQMAKNIVYLLAIFQILYNVGWDWHATSLS